MGQFGLGKLSDVEVKSLVHSGVLNISTFDKDFSNICSKITTETAKKIILEKFSKNILKKQQNNSSPIIESDMILSNDPKCGDIALTKNEIREILNHLSHYLSKINAENSYILQYKKDSYTLDEAKNLLASGSINTPKKDYSRLIA